MTDENELSSDHVGSHHIHRQERNNLEIRSDRFVRNDELRHGEDLLTTAPILQ